MTFSIALFNISAAVFSGVFKMHCWVCQNQNQNQDCFINPVGKCIYITRSNS